MKYRYFFVLVLFSFYTWGQQDCACCSEPYGAFDFWIGTWEVQLADGTPAGINRITKEQDGCMLREEWTSTNPGITGTSLNFYNADSGLWEQIWVDNQGNLLRLEGGVVDGEMVLSSRPQLNASNRLITNRITWTPAADGSVRQRWEVLEDQEVLQVLFEGYYRKARE